MTAHEETERKQPNMKTSGSGSEAGAGASGPLSPAAARALAEAEERRRAAANNAAAPREIGGRSGPDPIRYGDWEAGGIASDF